MDEILTAAQAAALLRLNTPTRYKPARNGSIPTRKLGGSWRFSKEAILKMVPGGDGAWPVEKRDRSGKEN